MNFEVTYKIYSYNTVSLNVHKKLSIMFIDAVDVKFRAGNGGNGIVSWRREARIAKGGPF